MRVVELSNLETVDQFVAIWEYHDQLWSGAYRTSRNGWERYIQESDRWERDYGFTQLVRDYSPTFLAL